MAELLDLGFIEYIKLFWNWVDSSISIVSLPCIYASIYLQTKTKKVFDSATSGGLVIQRQQGAVVFPSDYKQGRKYLAAELFALGRHYEVYDNLMALVVYLCTIRLFKYMSFSTALIELQTTLQNCYKDLLAFLFMFVAIIMAYALLGHMMFGTGSEAFDKGEKLT
ncbi:hypothetical protein ACOME3_006927 [Neoechinorhynchus agilis]